MSNHHPEPSADATGPRGSSNGPGRPSLTPEVVDAFNTIWDLPEHEQRAALDRYARGNASLRAVVQRMLDAERSPQGERLAKSLDDALVDIDDALTLPPSAHDGPLPEVDDRYALVRLLGSGSTGDVYLADQLRPVRRPVAIKVLRPSEVRRSTVERMRREAVALGALDHPGIATIYDTGVTRDGRPYLATEWVDGPPIDRWCAEHGATFATRCRLLAGVCRAVEHAHQRGVIHRDLKPGNILVRTGEGGPTPKIVDLGIARLLEPHHGPGLGLTRGGHLLGTIGFIAPEQLAGGAADVRSDLFALGRVLEGLPGGMEGQAASQRRDAAAIVRRATRADPRERYQSAGDMADDLDALLEGRPVAARRQSSMEACLRVVRLHKVATVLAVVALVSVAGAVVVVGHKSAQLADANHAQKEILKDTLDGLVRILGRYPGTRDERVALADRMEAHLATLMVLNPQDKGLRVLAARVGVERANIAIQDGVFDRAEVIARQATRTLEGTIDPGTASIDDLRVLAHAIVILGDSLHQLGRPEEARGHHERAMAIHERGVVRFPDHIGLLDDLSWSYDRLGKWFRPVPDAYADQEAWGAERLELAYRLLALDPERTLSKYNLALAHHRLASVYERQDPARSMEHVVPAISMLEELLADDPGRAGYIHNLAGAYRHASRLWRERGQTHEAIGHLQRAAFILTAHLGTFPTPRQSQPGTGPSDPFAARNLLTVAVPLANLYEQTGDHEAIAPLLALCAPYVSPGYMAGYANEEHVNRLMLRWNELIDTYSR